VDRHPRIWSRYHTEAIDRFGERSDVVFASHHWPTWGTENIKTYLAVQRDLYGYLHDQTLRMINKGMTGPEIAEAITLPPALEAAWSTHGYYGSVSHNVKAIYQRYMGWFDGNPAHLWEHPPVARAGRYVEWMGGAEAVLARAREAHEAGDYRWVAEVLGHVVFADPGNAEARELQADALEQLGYGAENATWRNFFLSGAMELREGVGRGAATPAPREIVARLSVDQLLDGMAVRLDGPRAAARRLRIDWIVTGPDSEHAIEVRNGVLRHRPGRHEGGADAALVIERAALDGLLLKTEEPVALAESGRLRVEGDGEALGALLGLLEDPNPAFGIVTPD
jgi:alkyl sulfatase BDS1-like metallo-beta-lactamase superfamily hydrolase